MLVKLKTGQLQLLLKNNSAKTIFCFLRNFSGQSFASKLLGGILSKILQSYVFFRLILNKSETHTLTRTERSSSTLLLEKDDKIMKIYHFWGREFKPLSRRYEERVQKFSFFFARYHFKVELYRYIYIVIFGKHLSKLYWIVLMCF